MVNTEQPGAEHPKVDTILLQQARTGLLILWLVGSAVSFLFLVVRTFTPAMTGEVNDVWIWYLARISQTILLIVHVVSADSLKQAPKKEVGRLYYRITYGVSALYLGLLTAILIAEAIYSGPGKTSTTFFPIHRPYLDFIQMLAVATLATFFGPEHSTPIAKKPESPSVSKNPDD